MSVATNQPTHLLTYSEIAERLGAILTEGATRVIAVDGYSGSGKTWFTQRLTHLLDATVLHLDDYVPGWDHLAKGITLISHEVVAPLRAGSPGCTPRYDWDDEKYAEITTWQPGGTLIIEGSGSGALPTTQLDALIWLDTPAHLRTQRLNNREDYDTYIPYRNTWADHEHRIAQKANTRDRADLVVVNATETRVSVLESPPRVHEPPGCRSRQIRERP